MPTKLGRGGSGPEDFDPDTGEYIAGNTVSKRGNTYWVHGDVMSRKITKEKYDEYKKAGYKEDFDNGEQKSLKLYRGAYGYQKTPSFYDNIGAEYNFNENDVMELLENPNLNQDQLKARLGKLVAPDESFNTRSQIGSEILREYNDQYQKILSERELKKFEPKIQAADEYLNTFSKVKPHNIERSNKSANLDNYKFCQYKYSHVEKQSGWLNINGNEEFKEDWEIRIIDDTKGYDEYTSNCQRCVVAWMLQMRGYDVQAKKYDDGESNKILDKFRPRIGYDIDFGTLYDYNWSYSAFNIPRGTKYDYHGQEKEHQKTQYSRIVDTVKNMPDKSICFCSVRWRGLRSSHVFCVYNDGGNVKFIDPQDNSDASRYFIGTNRFGQKYKIVAAETSLLRVNDLTLNGDALKEIVEAKTQYESI